MTEWGLVLTTLGLVIAALGGVFVTATRLGKFEQTVTTLKENDAERAKEIVHMRERLARGDTQLALLVDGMARIEKASEATANKVDDIGKSLNMMRDFLARAG